MLSLISEIPRPKTLARKKDVAFRQARHPLEGTKTWVQGSGCFWFGLRLLEFGFSLE